MENKKVRYTLEQLKKDVAGSHHQHGQTGNSTQGTLEEITHAKRVLESIALGEQSAEEAKEMCAFFMSAKRFI